MPARMGASSARWTASRGVSSFTSSACLSSRRPRKDAWLVRGGLDFANRLRMHETHAARLPGRELLRKWARGDDHKIELPKQIPGDLLREPGADPAGINQIARLLVSERQRPDHRLRYRRQHISDDHELLPQRALRLDAFLPSSRPVRRVAALRHHAFEAKAASVAKLALAFHVEIFAEADDAWRGIPVPRLPCARRAASGACPGRLDTADPRRRRRGSPCARWRAHPGAGRARSGAPLAVSATSSPSTIALSSGRSAKARASDDCQSAVQSRPLRVNSFAPRRRT